MQKVWRGVDSPQLAQVIGGPIGISADSSSSPRWITRRSHSSAITSSTARQISHSPIAISGSSEKPTAISTAPASSAISGLPSTPSASRSRTGARNCSHSAPPTAPITAISSTGMVIAIVASRPSIGRIEPAGRRPPERIEKL